MKIKTYNVIVIESNNYSYLYNDKTSCYAFDNKKEAVELFKEKVIFYIQDEDKKYDESELNKIVEDEFYQNEDGDMIIDIIESE